MVFLTYPFGEGTRELKENKASWSGNCSYFQDVCATTHFNEFDPPKHALMRNSWGSSMGHTSKRSTVHKITVPSNMHPHQISLLQLAHHQIDHHRTLEIFLIFYSRIFRWSIRQWEQLEWNLVKTHTGRHLLWAGYIVYKWAPLRSLTSFSWVKPQRIQALLLWMLSWIYRIVAVVSPNYK